MTNTVVSRMVGESQETSKCLWQAAPSMSSPTRGKPRNTKGNSNSPRNKNRNSDPPSDIEKKVRFGPTVQFPSRGSPNGKSRTSPSKDKSPRLSPSAVEYYAGFSDSPAPTALPKPPSHWVSTVNFSTGRPCSTGSFCQTILPNLKMVLSAQA